jgi:hypothetical protein
VAALEALPWIAEAARKNPCETGRHRRLIMRGGYDWTVKAVVLGVDGVADPFE